MGGPAGIIQLQQLLVRFINLSVGIAFIILTIMLVYAGFKFMMSAGDPKGLQTARNTLVYAIAGIVFMAMAWIVLLLIKAFTGVDVIHFCLGFPGSANNCELLPLPPGEAT